MKHGLLVLGGIAWLAACGGVAVVDDEGGASTGAAGTGASGTGASSAGASGTGASASGGSGTGAAGGASPVFCSTHDDCLGETACIFTTGTCAPTCDDDFCTDCGPGSVCDACATSTCPKCTDCLAACVSVLPGVCDGNNPCPEGQLCNFGTSSCDVVCSDGSCPPGLTCQHCASGSCCGCKDCVDLCIELDG